MYLITEIILKHWFVSIKGSPGLGKSTIAKMLAHRLLDRKIFDDGVVYLDLKKIDDSSLFLDALDSATINAWLEKEN